VETEIYGKAQKVVHKTKSTGTTQDSRSLWMSRHVCAHKTFTGWGKGATEYEDGEKSKSIGGQELEGIRVIKEGDSKTDCC